MKSVTFKDWTLTELEKAFGLSQVWECDLLTQWENNSSEMNEVEKGLLLNLQKSLKWGGRAWNEVELENKFISPLIMLANIDDGKIAYFLERPLSGIIGDYELSGIVDGMIATGIREPNMPYFCFHGYKRGIENQGSPDGQVLAAMLVAKELNQNHLPIYGLFVVGIVWNFVVLKGNEYCISQAYLAESDDVFTIFKIIKALKSIIYAELAVTQ